MITLRHILVALATPRRPLASFAEKPRSASCGTSAAASGPPSSRGTLIRYGGTAVMTAPSTYRPAPPATIPAAAILAPGEAELRSRKKLPAGRAGALASAAAIV